jgi:hypothetical protein
VRSALAALLLLSAPASAQVLEDFEHGNEGLYGVLSGTADTFNVSNAAARNGVYGGEFIQGTGPSWRARLDINTAPGNVYEAHVRLRGGVATNGRSYMGVGASAAGAWSAVFAPNTSQIILQNNTNFGFTTAATAAATITPDTWYLLRLTWAANGDMTVELWDETGTTLQASTGVIVTGFTTAGGLVFRGFTTNAAAFHDIDDFSVVGGGIGVNYCGPAVVNSSGASGEMGASGSADVSANSLTLEASDLPTNAFGFFLTSQTQGMIAQPGGSQGVLCLSGSIGRYVGAGQIQNSGAAGAFSLALDLTQTPTPMGLVSIASGETWNFQCWYRDAVGGVPTSNFTDGLTVVFN